MTLPASGAISFNAINVELGVAGTTQASLGQTSFRNLAGVASGQISMSNFYGKANQFAFTISSNQTNANLRTLAVNAGWNQSSKVVATINGGVYISSNSTGTPALTVNGSFPGGVELVNNGFIVGMGGAGGKGAQNTGGNEVASVAGSSGGLALSVSVGVSINNQGTIGGGGGGGGGGGRYIFVYYSDKSNTYYANLGGGGGGGGRSSNATNSAGGAGGSASGNQYNAAGPAGGAGTVSAAGAGGSGYIGAVNAYYKAGGSGGAWGSGGGTGVNGSSALGNTTGNAGAVGGSGGGAVSGNGNISWIATGTRLGSIG